VRGQSAQADFATFQRRIHSLLIVWRFAPVHLDGARQEPSAKADITFSVPRLQPRSCVEKASTAWK
jgi:hypothetical protein